MIHFILVRVFQALLTLLAASFLVFALARVTGSPADTMLPMDATPAEREAMITRLGLDQPIMQQYWRYLQDAVKGDFGVSLRTKRPVTELVGDRLFNSLKLASAAMAFTIIISLPLGVDRGGVPRAVLGPLLDDDRLVGAISAIVLDWYRVHPGVLGHAGMVADLGHGGLAALRPACCGHGLVHQCRCGAPACGPVRWRCWTPSTSSWRV